MPRELSMLEAQLTVEFPAVNILVLEVGDHAVITAEIPCIDPKTLNISVVNDSITLRFSRQSEELKEGGSYHRRDQEIIGEKNSADNLPRPLNFYFLLRPTEQNLPYLC